MKLALRATTSLACFTIASMAAMPAFAQEQTAAEQAAEDAAEQQAYDDANIIVVTAQGREQQLADVPVAISAVSGDMLQKSGANDIRELNQVAPSLLVSSTGNEANGSARIRGIGTVGDNAGLESSVAVFVDGVYRSRSGNALSELGPIDRIEILRGPQGTLGGRNSSAGLISIYTAKPKFEFGGYGAFSYGNYDSMKVEGGVNLPLGTTVAARVDGVYFKRDGFYRDVVNGVDVNDRDRYLLRGQLLWEPTDALTARLVLDYSKKDESCCAATFVQPDFAPLARVSPGLDSFRMPNAGSPALTSTANPIIPVLLGLGQNPAALTQSTFDRDIYVTQGRSYAGETEDYGASLELNYDLGGPELTSITGYREYSNFQGSDTDYTQVDILYRAPNENGGARAFKTFTQELRLQGSAFNDRVDWLVGGFYANEKLAVRDNLRFGSQYGAFAPCRIVNAINPALASPGSTGCLSAGGRAVLSGANGGAGAFGAATPAIFAGLDRLAGLNDLGSTTDFYNQKSESFAAFTHNIIHLTDRLDLTLGLRYTHETKDFDSLLGNDNTVCPAQRAALTPLLGIPGLGGLTGGLISLACQGNSTSELNGATFSDSRSENEFTGTGILSFKATDDLLLYASYSRGYKAGGFNLDRSALTGTFFSPTDTLGASNISVVVGPNALANTANLQFDQETVDAFEVGAKYSIRDFTFGVSAFRQQFSNFQLNTFNGSVFLVQNVNACTSDLNGADRDAFGLTGACDADDVTYGVVAQGVELEATMKPSRYLNFTAGLTLADTSYEDNLIGNENGSPLDPALRLLPGDNLSNAPEITATASASWTPPIGNGGLSGLVYVNARSVGDYNTGSDLLFGKEQDGFALVNARIGIRGPDEKWAIEGWASNLFDVDYTQVAFNTPFVASQQTYSAFLAEPRTYGVTVRGKF
ncbi:TonB-dependent receptor [Altererythrobacter confluentis]|uniref:TonB-dependent receptor n=1 Tax=Allopontixanthobacter confluentis TaxID=1849021 RepID=A0A6L7GIP2_9SPHN|nr:TonB-dependent receptor [Allopontixanthobacter confluentis]MXP15455.1 TonB-dependent receptor [Allopontixanthobacter confluentis]